MSGPKSSEYSISPAERRRQEEERRRRLEEEKCSLLEREIAFKSSRINTTVERVEKSIEYPIQQAKLVVPESAIIDNVEQIVTLLRKQADEVNSRKSKRNSASLGSRLAQVDTALQNTLTQEGTVQEYLDLLNKHIKIEQTALSEAKELSDIKTMQRTTTNSFDLSMPVVPNAHPHPEEVNFESSLIDFMAIIETYLSNELLGDSYEIASLKKSVLDITQNRALDKEYVLKSIELRKKAFLSTCEKYDRQIQNNRQVYQQFQELNYSYITICNMLGESPKSFLLSIQDAQKLNMELSKEIENCNARLVRKQESGYIADSINEVMQDLGYDVVASDFMSTPKRDIIHNIYEFEQGNVINVFTSDNGGLMFEVTGVKETNHLTELEKLKVKEGMESFCSRYEQIKNRLREKGIEINAENLKPADIKYARAIDISSKKTVKTRAKTAGVKKDAKKNQASL